MKKENFISTIIYLIMIATGFLLVWFVLRPELSTINVMPPFWFGLIFMIAALLINIIGLELLHALGAKLGGYSVESVNFLRFNFEKIDNKWVFSFKDFNGLTGETKITPKKEKTNLKPFVWIPFFGYAFELIVCLTINFIAKDPNLNLKWLSVICLIFIIVSAILEIYNIMPFKLDSENDGYKFVLLNKKECVESFNELMSLEHIERNGGKIDSIKKIDNINYYSAKVNLKYIYNCLYSLKYEEASEMIETLLQSNCDEEIKYRALAQKIFILAMTKDVNEAKEFYDNNFKYEMRRFIANDNCIESLRAYLLVAGIIDDSQSEIKLISQKISKLEKNTFQSIFKKEKEMVELTKAKILETHNDWKKEDIN